MDAMRDTRSIRQPRTPGHCALSLLAAAVLVFSLVPLPPCPGANEAHAQGIRASNMADYAIYCGSDGKLHRDSANGTVIENTPTVSWSNSGGSYTLALNGCSLSTASTPAIYLEPAKNVTVSLTGANTIFTTGSTAIGSQGDLAVTGTGSLTLSVITTDDAYGLNCGGALSVNGATVKANLTIGPDGTQNAYGIVAKGDCAFTNATVDSSYVSGTGKTQSLAIASLEGGMSITNSVVTAESGSLNQSGASAAGLFARSNISISGGKVTARGGAVSAQATGAASGNSNGIYSEGGLLNITNNANVTTSSGNVNVTSTNGGAANAMSRGVFVGSTVTASRDCNISGTQTTLDVTAGDAVGHGSANSSSNSIGIFVRSAYAKPRITGAHVTLRSGNAGSSDTAATDCGSYGFFGDVATYLKNGRLDSQAGNVQTSATATAADADKKFIASYGYMSSVTLIGTCTFVARGGRIDAPATLEKYNGSYGWGVTPGRGMSSSSPSISGDSSGCTIEKLVMSGYTAAANYKHKVLIESYLKSCKCYVGDNADGSDKAVLDESPTQDTFTRRYVQAQPAKTVTVPTVTSFTYDEQPHTAVSAGSGYTLSGTISATDAGDYHATAILDDPDGSIWSDGTSNAKILDWSIAKRQSFVALPDKTIAYSGSPATAPAATVTGTSGEVTCKYYDDAEAGTEIPAPTNAGTYFMKAFAAEDTNNTGAESAVATLIIEPKRIADPAVHADLAYNESEQTGVEPGEGYSITGNVATDVGTYTATAKLLNANYTWSDGSAADRAIIWRIYQRATTATLTGLTCSYDGKRHAVGGAAVSGSTGAVSYHYYEDELLVSELAAPPVNAGTYYARAVVEPSGEYAGALSNVVTLTIRKAANAISGASTFTKVGKVGSSTTFNIDQRAASGVLAYSSSDPGCASVDKSGQVTLAKNHTGTIIITVSTNGSINYEPASKVVAIHAKPGRMTLSKTKNVKKRTIEVNWKTMVGADKYQVQRALNGKFTKGKKTYAAKKSSSSRKLTRLKKGKTYYLRIRAFDAQTNAWGAWSSAKKAKVIK